MSWTAAQPGTPLPYRSPASRLSAKPNIVLILADELGYADVGCYGQAKIKTPNIDQLAAEGMRFTQCYAGSAVCAASRCCLLTGLDTGHAWIRGNAKVPLRAQDFTVADLLQQAGYRTAAVGQWGLGLAGTTGAPNRQGFNDWFGFLGSARAHHSYPQYLWRNDRKTYLWGNLNGRKGDYAPDWFARVATNFIRVEAIRPFFLYFAATLPHATSQSGRAAGSGIEAPSDAPYSTEPWPQPEKAKAAMITRLDTEVGQIMAQIKNLRLDDDTVVFFTSDNGPPRESGVDPKFFASSGPLRGAKRELYEGGIRVPMIVRWPGKIKPGSVSDQVWAFWDFLPTAAVIAGIRPPAHLDGLSILPALLGKPQKQQHRFLYWESHEDGFKQAVRMGDWKAVRLAPGKPFELYNLKTDLGERHDVAAAHPGVVSTIEAYLKTARTASPHWPLQPDAKPQATE